MKVIKKNIFIELVCNCGENLYLVSTITCPECGQTYKANASVYIGRKAKGQCQQCYKWIWAPPVHLEGTDKLFCSEDCKDTWELWKTWSEKQ